MNTGNWTSASVVGASDSPRVHTMQGRPGWGNWMFAVDGVFKDSVENRPVNVSFSEGGWQTAASDAGGLADFFVEGALELLDSPGEFFLANGTLYLYPNGSTPEFVTVPVLRELVSIEGTQRSPVRHLVFDSITFAHTTPTFMEKYSVPGPGDWSIR